MDEDINILIENMKNQNQNQDNFEKIKQYYNKEHYLYTLFDKDCDLSNNSTFKSQKYNNEGYRRPIKTDNLLDFTQKILNSDEIPNINNLNEYINILNIEQKKYNEDDKYNEYDKFSEENKAYKLLLSFKLLSIPIEKLKKIKENQLSDNIGENLIEYVNMYKTFILWTKLLKSHYLFKIYKYAFIILISLYLEKILFLLELKPNLDKNTDTETFIKSVFYDEINSINIYNGQIIEDIKYIENNLKNVSYWFNNENDLKEFLKNIKINLNKSYSSDSSDSSKHKFNLRTYTKKMIEKSLEKNIENKEKSLEENKEKKLEILKKMENSQKQKEDSKKSSKKKSKKDTEKDTENIEYFKKEIEKLKINLTELKKILLSDKNNDIPIFNIDTDHEYNLELMIPDLDILNNEDKLSETVTLQINNKEIFYNVIAIYLQFFYIIKLDDINFNHDNIIYPFDIFELQYIDKNLEGNQSDINKLIEEIIKDESDPGDKSGETYQVDKKIKKILYTKYLTEIPYLKNLNESLLKYILKNLNFYKLDEEKIKTQQKQKLEKKEKIIDEIYKKYEKEIKDSYKDLIDKFLQNMGGGFNYVGNQKIFNNLTEEFSKDIKQKIDENKETIYELIKSNLNIEQNVDDIIIELNTKTDPLFLYLNIEYLLNIALR